MRVSLYQNAIFNNQSIISQSTHVSYSLNQSTHVSYSLNQSTHVSYSLNQIRESNRLMSRAYKESLLHTLCTLPIKN